MGHRRNVLPVALAALLLITTASDATAQMRRDRGRPGLAAGPEAIDLSAMYGHMWGGSVNTRPGTLRLGTAPSWFFAADIPVAPATWLEVSYGHQDGQLDLDRSSGKVKLSDLSVNYWQIGGVRGLPTDRLIPYVAASLGINHLSPAESTVEVDGETGRLESTTRFAITLGVGFKAFFGQSERIGVRGSVRTMSTFYETGSSFWFGSGGGGWSFGGRGIWQWEVAGGVTVRLG
jgi:hypothetical protein